VYGTQFWKLKFLKKLPQVNYGVLEYKGSIYLYGLATMTCHVETIYVMTYYIVAAIL